MWSLLMLLATLLLLWSLLMLLLVTMLLLWSADAAAGDPAFAVVPADTCIHAAVGVYTVIRFVSIISKFGIRFAPSWV